MTTREETIKNKKKNMKKKKNEKQRERVSKSKAAFLTCHSSNRKRLHPHGQHHLRWSTTVSDSEPDHEDTTTVTRSLPSSDFLLMHMASRGNNNNNNNINPCSSSLASCPAFSLASLDDKCPSTPSPVCSPLSSDLLLHHSTTTTPPPLPHHHHHHHHHDQQGICAMANGCKKLVVGQEVSPLHKIIREGGEGGEKQSWTPKSNGSAASRLSRSACKYLLCDKEIMGDNNNCDGEDGGRVMLPVLVEEKEDKRCNKGDRHLPPPTQSSHFSADNDDDDDAYYTRSSSGGRGSEEYDGNSENASMVGKEERVKPMNGIGIDPPDIRTEVEAKLNAWKEAKTYKLLNKMRNEEAKIAEFERNEMEKAKIDMKKMAIKLEKQRERAMMRMHRKIRHAKEHAKQKMLKERETTARKISSVSKSFDNINTGKISWKLICC